MRKFASLAERIGRTFHPGEVLFRQGDTGDHMFMIYSGKVEVVREEGGDRMVLAALGPGEIVGEMALVDGMPRSATVTAIAETRVIPIDGDFLRRNAHRDTAFLFQILETLSLRIERTSEMLLSKISASGRAPDFFMKEGLALPASLAFLKIFRGFADPDRYLHLRTDQVVFHQGDFGDLMYIVLDGTVLISVETRGETCMLGELVRGDFFGEASLISGGARNSTARAITPAVLLPVDRDTLVQGVSRDPAAALYLIQVLIGRLRADLKALSLSR